MSRVCLRALATFIVLAAGVFPSMLRAESRVPSRAAPARGSPDGGSPAPDAGRLGAALTREDAEVVDNLELLEHMEESEQLDLLLELSRDD